MPKVLSDRQVAQYERHGFVCPVDVLGAEDVADLRRKLETFEASEGGALKPDQRSKSHLLFKWLDDLIRDPRVLDPVEDLIGPNILCWNTLFWIKEAGAESFVSWHQDANYWGLEGADLVTAWLALSPAKIENGCMKVMPGTHKLPPMAHEDRYRDGNMLTRGQEISEKLNETKALYMPLEPGQMSMHSIRLAHASGSNKGTDRRIGVSMHFVPTHMHQAVGEWDSAALVRGVDEYGNFEPTPRPASDLDPAAVAFHERATAAVREILYRDAAVQTGRL